MKALIMTDIEGVSGVVSFEHQAYADGRYYEQARTLLTGEVNAAVEAATQAGCDEILVIDGHGPGAVRFEELHPAASLAHGRPPAPRERREEYYRDFDISMMIGQHAMAGSERGPLNHTQSSRAVDYYALNGKPIGEIAQWSLYVGALGIPMIFLSGDDRACAEAADLIPGVSTAAVKTGLSRSYAISKSHKRACRLIGEGVTKAIAKHHRSPLAPLVWPGPFTLVKRFMTTEQADQAATSPGTRRIDNQTVELSGDDILRLIYA